MTETELLLELERMNEALGEARALLHRIAHTEPPPSLRGEILDYLQRTG